MVRTHLWTDKHLWKHYLPTTSFADGNNFQQLPTKLILIQVWLCQRAHWIRNGVTDNYLSFILNSNQYGNESKANFVYFEKKTVLYKTNIDHALHTRQPWIIKRVNRNTIDRQITQYDEI